MSISNKIIQLNQVKQDIKTAIEMKGIPMTNVAFTEYANKIADISGGGGGGGDFPTISYDEIEHFGWSYYIFSRSNVIEQIPQAWQDMKEVDGAEIERASSYSTQYGTLQYPNGEDNGVIIPNSITSIGENAFRGWTSNNQPLVIPDSVTSIGGSAFYNWTSNNQPLVIPNSVTRIGDGAFGNWSSNNQPLVIPNSVTSIGDGAFGSWSSNNQPLVIPNSVTSIGNYAFRDWSLVPYVEIQAITPPTLVSTGAFSGLPYDTRIYVPDWYVDDYQTATNWVDLAWRIFPISEKT